MHLPLLLNWQVIYLLVRVKPLDLRFLVPSSKNINSTSNAATWVSKMIDYEVCESLPNVRMRQINFNSITLWSSLFKTTSLEKCLVLKVCKTKVVHIYIKTSQIYLGYISHTIYHCLVRFWNFDFKVLNFLFVSQTFKEM